ncbi:hypothetical protein [Paraglaciecola sp. L3A3]|nr:hypothetical protein [Paraglaciecola sp. L3A3]
MTDSGRKNGNVVIKCGEKMEIDKDGQSSATQNKLLRYSANTKSAD